MPFHGFAQVACHELFQPQSIVISEEDIQKTILDLADLAQDRLSPDSTKSSIAKSAFDEKLKSLSQHMPIAEIRERIKEINDRNGSKIQTAPKAVTRNEVHDKIAVDIFFQTHRDFLLIDDPQSAVLLAARLGQFDLIEPLLKFQKEHYNEILSSEWFMNDDYRSFSDILEKVLDLDAKYSKPGQQYAQTALSLAVEAENINAVKILLKNGASPSESLSYSNVPYNAIDIAYKKNKTIYDLLIADSEFVLETLRRLKDYKNVLKLLESHPELYIKALENTAHDAVLNQQYDIVEFIIKNRAHDVNRKHSAVRDFTLLHQASAIADHKMVQLLLSLNADVNIQVRGLTPLSVVGNPDILKSQQNKNPNILQTSDVPLIIHDLIMNGTNLKPKFLSKQVSPLEHIKDTHAVKDTDPASPGQIHWNQVQNAYESAIQKLKFQDNYRKAKASAFTRNKMKLERATGNLFKKKTESAK